MSISTFFSSFAGMYVAQSFSHALIASVILDQALRAWKIDNPAIRQRFRLTVVLYPIFSFPLYQLINPDRGSVLFRLNALFDINRWLNVELGGVLPLSFPFLFVLAVTSLIFLFQEMIPVVKHTLDSRAMEHEGTPCGSDPFLENASRALSIKTPQVFTLDDDELIIFSTTGKDPLIFVSTGLTRALTPDEMQAALAHEIAHIARSRRPLLLAAFFLRVILFFNPVALIEFRRVVRNEEKICDDIAVSLTHRPGALAEALKKFYAIREAPEPDAGQKPMFAPVRLEEYSYNMQLDSRITRLEQHSPHNTGGRWFPLIIAFLIVLCINYFVV
ncbi:MAG: M56 family metallopeptidase [Betaproteobacteria bacterium]